MWIPSSATTTNGARMNRMNATDESPTPLGLRMLRIA